MGLITNWYCTGKCFSIFLCGCNQFKSFHIFSKCKSNKDYWYL